MPRLRAARLGDLPELDRIARQAKAHWGYRPEQIAQWDHELRTAPETLARWPTEVALIGDEVVGFVQLNPEDSPWALFSLWVSPAHIGRGVGRLLMQSAVRRARAEGVHALHIDADPHAAGFYRACGAVRVGEVAAPIEGQPSRTRPQFCLYLDRLIDATPDHFPAILELNAASVQFLSPLDPKRLAWLHALAAYRRVVVRGDAVIAFLLAFAPGSVYDSINYQWFAARLSNFLYVDRIVVSAQVRSQGIGSSLYRDVFDTAASQGWQQVVCEIDAQPPNPVSDAFHRRYGFEEIGTQWVAGGSKRVSLQSAPVRPPQSPRAG